MAQSLSLAEATISGEGALTRRRVIVITIRMMVAFHGEGDDNDRTGN